MKLQEALHGLPVRGAPGLDVEVTGVAHDSRRVMPGDLFVAIPGERFDGRRFAAEAAAQGAVAVLAGGPPLAETPVPWLEADDPRAVMGPLAARLYGYPDRDLTVVGVTGTNGKTTVVWILQAMLEAAGRPAGRIGTLGYEMHGERFGEGRTTPESADLFAVLAGMRRAGAAAVAMEVSSHALALGRVAGLTFAGAAFLNLTQDHLDFHADMEAYFRAKSLLFEQLAPGGAAAVNVDDPWGSRLAAAIPGCLTFGAGGEVAVETATLRPDGTSARLVTPRGRLDLVTSLLGRYNLENLLAAVAIAEALGLPHDAIREAATAVRPVPGRLERVGAGEPFPVFVDYAHTPAALAAALRTVRELTEQRIVVVFGCGGERDRGKRQLMGRVAGELADLAIVTSDNPRGEDPLAIVAAVEEGVKEAGARSYRVIPDRREAIRAALSVAGPGTTVVVAGKGHETGQEVAGRIIPFSDRDEIERALEERHGVANGG